MTEEREPVREDAPLEEQQLREERGREEEGVREPPPVAPRGGLLAWVRSLFRGSR